MKKFINSNISTILFAVFIVLGMQLILITYSDGLFTPNPYNSFTRQCLAWLEGRLDLGQNYTWLELAVYNEKYYVSFPPFPSYVLLPFAAIFGVSTPDNLITTCVMLIGVIYTTKIALHYKLSQRYCIMISILVYSASAVMQLTMDSGVWFFAQNMSFTLTLMGIYYAALGKKGKSMFFLCCAVGCRPFQLIYLPLAIYLICQKIDEQGFLNKAKKLCLDKIYVFIPATLMALSFMILNYARFGNIFEFGHNYLPEFTNAEYGQFHYTYIIDNISTIFRLPTLSETLKFEIPLFNGMNIFICFPIIIWAIYLFVKAEFKDVFRDKKFVSENIFIFILLCIHILLLLSHRTMGAIHFGNRYIADILPIVVLSVCRISGMKKIDIDTDIISARMFDILIFFGIYFNAIGMYQFYLTGLS